MKLLNCNIGVRLDYSIKKSKSFFKNKKQGVEVLQIGALTDSGVVRENNEDCYAIIRDQEDRSVVIIVADGMGGHRAGGTASQLTCELVEDLISLRLKSGNLCDENIEDFLQEVTQNANRAVLEFSSKYQETKGMGTTLTVLILEEDNLLISHVGDSRVYYVSETELVQLTVDHSYVQELLDNGTITKEEAISHPSKNVITRAIGGSPDVYADIYRKKTKSQDLYLSCTDGLTNMLTEQEIFEVLKGEGELSQKATRLIEMANQKGGGDNITVCLVQLD